MAWKDKLQPASFRGAVFHVEADEMGGGRRVQVHEYPQRDKPFTEDLGRAAREVSVTAFLVGADFLSARDQLLGALEEPGPGTLVHPWFGSLQVVAKEWRVRHDKQRLGMCEVQLSFVEAGELAFPTASANSQAQTRIAADTLHDAALDDFEGEFSLADMPGHVRDAAFGDLGRMLDTLSDAVGSVTDPANTLRGDLGDLVDTPRELGARVFGLFSAAQSSVGGYLELASSVRSLLRGTRRFGHKTASLAATPARKQTVRNTNAVAAIARRAQLVQAAGLTSVMPLPVHNEAVQLRNDLTGALDDEALTASDTVYPALTDLRVKVHQDITARSRDAARLDTVTPPEVLPSLVLAYDLYEDAGREGEIVDRNAIAHPGFLPVAPLLVLSR